MQCRSIVLALALLVPLAALAQTSAPPAKNAPRSYMPGLEVFMNLIQTEHAKLWYAGSAGNWALAAYQLGEIKEIMSDVQDLVPTFRKLPLDKMMDAVITKEIADLEKALDEKSAGKFAAAFTALTQACNACHQATGNGFIVIQRPAGQAFPNQDFNPQK